MLSKSTLMAILSRWSCLHLLEKSIWQEFLQCPFSPPFKCLWISIHPFLCPSKRKKKRSLIPWYKGKALEGAVSTANSNPHMEMRSQGSAWSFGSSNTSLECFLPLDFFPWDDLRGPALAKEDACPPPPGIQKAGQSPGQPLEQVPHAMQDHPFKLGFSHPVLLPPLETIHLVCTCIFNLFFSSESLPLV